MKQIIRRTAALVLGLALGAVSWAGLESVTHISDLNASWPLGSDLASTSDDHIRNIKTALKNDFPNINSAVTATPTQINQLTGLSTAQGDILYASATNTLVNLAKSTSSTRYLSNTGASNNPAWAQVSLTTGVSGNLPSTSLDLTMSPTWTGAHIFSGNAVRVDNNAKNGLVINSGGTNFGTIQNDAANTWSLGTTASAGTLGSSILKWTSAGNVTIAAPSSGVPLTITTPNSTVNGIQITGGGSSASALVGLIDGQTGTRQYQVGVGQIAVGAFSIYDATASAERIRVSSTGNTTVNAASSGNTFTANGEAAAAYAGVFAGSNTSGARGLLVNGGTTGSSDIAVLVTDAPNSLNLFEILNSPQVLARGPVAASLVDMTPDTGTFTATMTGGATSPTCTARWTRIGNLVMLEICVANATSNATSFTYTGLPSAVQPAVTQHLPAAAGSYENNNTTLPNGVEVVMTASSGTITFWLSGSATGWTSVGIKGITSINTVSYLLN